MTFEFDIEGARSALVKKLLSVEKPSMDKRLIIYELRHEIKALREKGISFEEIAEALHGVTAISKDDLLEYFFNGASQSFLEEFHESMSQYLNPFISEKGKNQ